MTLHRCTSRRLRGSPPLQHSSLASRAVQRTEWLRIEDSGDVQIEQVVELFAPFGGVVSSQALGKNRSNLKVMSLPFGRRCGVDPVPVQMWEL